MLPNMNQLSICLIDVENLSALKQLLTMYNLTIIAEEPNYLIVDGESIDILEFKLFWNED